MSSLRDGRYAEVAFDFNSESPTHSWMARGVDGSAVRLIVPQHQPTAEATQSPAAPRRRDLRTEYTAIAPFAERQRAAKFYQSPSYLSARSELAPIFNSALAAHELWEHLWIDAWPALEKVNASVGLEAYADRTSSFSRPNQEKIMCLTVYELAAQAVNSLIAQGTSVAIGCAVACAGSAGCANYGAATPGCWAYIAGCVSCLGLDGYGAIQTCMNMWDSIMK